MCLILCGVLRQASNPDLSPMIMHCLVFLHQEACLHFSSQCLLSHLPFAETVAGITVLQPLNCRHFLKKKPISGSLERTFWSCGKAFIWRYVCNQKRTDLQFLFHQHFTSWMFVTFKFLIMSVTFNYYLIVWFSEYLTVFSVQLEKNPSILPQTSYASWENALLTTAHVQRCHHLSSNE